MRFVIFCVTLCCAKSAASNDQNFVISFLEAFFEQRNVVVSAHFCWRRSDLFQFSKNLAQLSKRVKMLSEWNEKGFQTMSTNNYFVVDTRNCITSINILNNSNAKNYFRFHLKWLIMVSDSDYKKLLQNKTILVDSDVTLAVLKEEYIKLLQPYRINSVEDLIWEEYGYFDSTHGLKETLKNIPTLGRRLNLKGAKLRVFVYVSKNNKTTAEETFKDRHMDTLTKQDFPTVTALMKLCNANYNVSYEHSYGYYRNDTGRIDGIVGALHENRGDISGVSLICTADRLPVIDCLKQINPLSVKFILRRPSVSSVENIMKTAFGSDVWKSVFAVSILFAVGFYMILKWDVKFRGEKAVTNYGISDASLVSMEALCQQGTTMEPKSLSGRIIVFVLFTAFMFVHVAYSAKIVVLLQSVATLKDLSSLLTSPLEAGVYDTPYMRLYASRSSDSATKGLYDRKITSKGFYSTEEGMERVRKGNFAFLCEIIPAYRHASAKFTDYEICSLQELEAYGKLEGYVITPKYSPYKEIFKAGLLRLDEVGIQTLHFDRMIAKPKCSSKSINFQIVGILEAYQAIAFVAYGIVASLLIFVAEKLTQRMQSRRLNNQNRIEIRTKAEFT